MRAIVIGGLIDSKVEEALKINRVDLESANEDGGMGSLVDQVKGGATTYDVLLLGIGAKWGSHLAQRMRTEGISIPIVGIAEESATPADRATFLESGGDDLVRCPLSVRELLASMRAVSRRARGSLSDINFFTQGGSVISFDASTGQLKS